MNTSLTLSGTNDWNPGIMATKKSSRKSQPEKAPKPLPRIQAVTSKSASAPHIGCSSIRFEVDATRPARPKASAGVSFAAVVQRKIWDRTRLRVSFVDGSRFDPTGLMRSRIKAVAQLWSDASYAGINFDWTDQLEYDADIRVSLSPDGTFWSLVGTDSRLSGSNLVTMNLGFNNSEYYRTEDTSNFYVREFHRLVLHEFGHALGFIHEHLSPKSGIVFNEPAAIAYFRQYGLSHLTDDQIRQQVLSPDPEGENLTEFDLKSVMLYPFPASIATPATDNNWQLSERDIQSVRIAYPKGRRVLERPGTPVNVLANPQTPYLLIADYPILYRFQAPSTGKFSFEVIPALPTAKNPIETIGLIDLSDPLRAVALAQGIVLRMFVESTSPTGDTQIVEDPNNASKPAPDQFASIRNYSMTKDNFYYIEARNMLGTATDWSRFRLRVVEN